MYSNGQRRLRVGVFHGNGISSGTVIDSSSGRLPGQYVLNLKNLINLAKQQGFVEVVVALHTLGIYDPTSWAKTQNFDAQISGALEENWGVIQSIMPVIESANIRVLIDLGNEAYIPYGVNGGRTIYLRTLWDRFIAAYDVGLTVGFSVRPSEARNLRHAREVYGNNPPYVMDVHAYDNAYGTVRSADKGLNEANYKYTSLVIGETYYNDQETAQALRNAVNNTSRAVHWVLQWPLTQHSACPQVNIAPPLNFDKYINHGF